MPINLRRLERELLRPDLGSEHSSGLLVSIDDLLKLIDLSIDHAHPLMICGHPFKGGSVFSTGYLQHPDMKRFGINDSTFFQPPRPTAWANALGVATASAATFPSFGEFFGAYF